MIQRLGQVTVFLQSTRVGVTYPKFPSTSGVTFIHRSVKE